MGSTANTACGISQFNGGSGFQHWSYRVKMFLDSAGVVDTLTEVAPAAEAERKRFEEADRKAKSHIVGFLANECLEVVREKNTAKAMWEALENTFAKKSIGTQNLLRKQLNRMKLKEGGSMREHILVFEDLIRQMKTAGAKLEEGDIVVSLFQTLPESFDPLVTALENLSMEDLTLQAVKERLLAEDLKRTDRHEDLGETKAAAFSGENKKGRKFKPKCYRCGKRGHYQKDCREKVPSETNSTSQRKANEASSANQRKAVSFAQIVKVLISRKENSSLNWILVPVTIWSTATEFSQR